MELRQLALFVAACQRRSLSETARSINLSLSSLSGTLKALERTLDLQLFERSPTGLAVTEAGRWLFQEAENLLRREETLRFSECGALDLRVESPLRFMFGTLSRASAAAVRQMHRDNPGLHVSVAFASPYAAGLGGRERRTADVVMGYAGEGVPGGSFLFADEWIAVSSCPMPHGSRGVAGTLWLPPYLQPSEEARFLTHCRAAGWPEPERLEDDGGLFERLRGAKSPTCLVAPRSLVAARLARSGMADRPLDPPFRSPVVATVTTTGPALQDAARRFVEAITGCIRSPQPFQDYAPILGLRDIRAFKALAAGPSLSNAAQRLGMSQPALSMLLSGMERKLDKRLFDRRSRGIALSLAGQAIATTLGRLAQQAQSIESQAKLVAMQERRRVMLAHSEAILLCPALASAFSEALAEWQAVFPGTHLTLLETGGEDIETVLRTGEIGFALHEDVSPIRSIACLGRLVVVGDDDAEAARPPGLSGGMLALPAGASALGRIVASLPGKAGQSSAVRASSLAACLALSKSGYRTILPERIASSLHPDSRLRALTPDVTVYLKAQPTTERSLGEAEQHLLSCIRRRFRAVQAESAR